VKKITIQELQGKIDGCYKIIIKNLLVEPSEKQKKWRKQEDTLQIVKQYIKKNLKKQDPEAVRLAYIQCIINVICYLLEEVGMIEWKLTKEYNNSELDQKIVQLEKRYGASILLEVEYPRIKNVKDWLKETDKKKKKKKKKEFEELQVRYEKLFGKKK